MKVRLFTLAVSIVSLIFSRAFVVVLLTCNSNAASLQPSKTRQNGEDLQVIILDSQGYRAKTLYYGYDQLLTLPTVTVKTERDPNTNTPATYTGIYISDLFEAFGADTSFDVIGAKCSNGQKQYYDRNYVARHRPIFLLKFDGKPPADFPSTEHGWVGPYCVVHESFSPAETVYGYVEQPRNAPGVVSLELTSFDQSLGRFTPKQGGNDPEVVKGQKIAVGSCLSCHNLGNAGGGQEMGTSWAVLAERAVTSRDNFRKKVTDPRSLNTTSHMPPHPEFDDKTLNALEAYFKAMMPSE
jgi:hypothetical protein